MRSPPGAKDATNQTRATALTPKGTINLDRYMTSSIRSASCESRAEPHKLLTAAQLTYKESKRLLLDQFEKEYFTNLYEQTGRNLSEMGRRAKLHRDYVRQYLLRHRILPDE